MGRRGRLAAPRRGALAGRPAQQPRALWPKEQGGMPRRDGRQLQQAARGRSKRNKTIGKDGPFLIVDSADVLMSCQVE